MTAFTVPDIAGIRRLSAPSYQRNRQPDWLSPFVITKLKFSIVKLYIKHY